MPDLVTVLAAAFGSGGAAAAIVAIITSRATAQKTRAEAEKIGATSDAEVDSVAMATMRAALESAQGRIDSLTAERKADREYYTQRIEELEARVETLRAEVRAAERRLADVLASTEATATEIQRLKHPPHTD